MLFFALRLLFYIKNAFYIPAAFTGCSGLSAVAIVYDFRKISKPTIYNFFLNTHSAKLGSNHLFSEETFSKNWLSLQSGLVEWVAGSEFGLCSHQSSSWIQAEGAALRILFPSVL